MQGHICDRLGQGCGRATGAKTVEGGLVPVVEIWQLAGTLLSLFQDLISMLQEHIVEQWKQTVLLEWIAHVQELDHADWVQVEMENLETSLEENKEVEMEMKRDEGQNGSPLKDKGKGKEKENERAEDGNRDGNRNRNEGGDGNGEADREMLQ